MSAESLYCPDVLGDIHGLRFQLLGHLNALDPPKPAIFLTAVNFRSWFIPRSPNAVHTNIVCGRFSLCNLSCRPSPGGSNALTVYQVGNDVVGPTPAPTTDVEEPQYEDLGCAADLTTGVRVRDDGRDREGHDRWRVNLEYSVHRKQQMIGP